MHRRRGRTLALRHPGWQLQQSYPVVLVVVGYEGQTVPGVDDMSLEDSAVPVAHSIDLAGLQDDVHEAGT
jgi:hypothetical protein